MIELDSVTEWSATTEAFLAQLHKSSELLKEDRADEAQTILRNAFEKRSDDPFGQATLALVYFKLGIYSRALSIYSRLVADYPAEPTLRFNLGLVHLKMGQSERAVSELQEAIRIAPDYRKAHGYLGLAYQRVGSFTLAREEFEIAGAKHMAERMNRFAEPEEAGARIQKRVEGGSLDLSYHDPEEDKEDATGIDEDLKEFMKRLPFSTVMSTWFFGEEKGMREPLPVSELTMKSKLPEPMAGSFLVSETGYLLMNISSRGYTRFSGLNFLSAEKLSYKPVMRRYRARPSEEIFGSVENPLFQVQGMGKLGFYPQKAFFNAILLDGEATYFREECVFAFDEGVSYENGRIPGSGAMLVNLRGRGSLVIQTPTKPHSLEVSPERGIIVPVDQLVGWVGRILPKPARGTPFDSSKGALELTGEGALFICLPDA